uniref:Uncharacterized protein n=1 Tax=Cyprinus carpio TaxID=7962 RepID=A0A8C1T5S0_CYPCA
SPSPQVFRAVLLLYLLALLLNSAFSEKKSKRKRKSLSQKKRKWVILDPSLNLSVNVPRLQADLCHHGHMKSYDSSRIPSKISEAKCEKTGCLTKDGEEDLGLESKPIYYQINVFRRVKTKKATHYTLQWETKIISLGCTCVQPVVVRQN